MTLVYELSRVHFIGRLLSSLTSSFSFSFRTVGLKNVGNTCYVNSLLQTYYWLAPLRNTFLCIDASDSPDDTVKDKRTKNCSRHPSLFQIPRSLLKPNPNPIYPALIKSNFLLSCHIGRFSPYFSCTRAPAAFWTHALWEGVLCRSPQPSEVDGGRGR